MFDYDLIYNTYKPKLTSLVNKQLKDKDSVEDIVQDVLTKVYLNQDKYDKDKFEISTWIYSICFNELKNYFRTLSRRPDLTYVETVKDNDSTVLLDNPQDIISSAETEAKYQSLLDNLSDNNLQAYSMKELDGHTYKYIAEKTGVSENTAKSRVKRTRDFISASLQAS